MGFNPKPPTRTENRNLICTNTTQFRVGIGPIKRSRSLVSAEVRGIETTTSELVRKLGGTTNREGRPGGHLRFRTVRSRDGNSSAHGRLAAMSSVAFGVWHSSGGSEVLSGAERTWNWYPGYLCVTVTSTVPGTVELLGHGREYNSPSYCTALEHCGAECTRVRVRSYSPPWLRSGGYATL